MFANPDSRDKKMRGRIKIISLHSSIEMLEKQFKNNVLRFVKYLT